MRRSSLAGWGIWATLPLLLAAVVCRPALAAEPKDYAYLFLQGRIEDPKRGTPAAGATVRLTDGAETFEAITDSQGTFVFNSLPVTSFELTVTTSDGRVVRGMRQLERLIPKRARLGVTFGQPARDGAKKKGEQEVLLDTGEQQVSLTVPTPAPNWTRFWKQALIFVGVAALFAL